MQPSADPPAADDRDLSRMRAQMLRFAALQLRDDALAEDVVQEAFVSALQKNEQFAGRSAFKTWVFSILRNKIIDAMRLRGRSVNVSALGEDEAAMDETFDSLFKANAHWQPWAAPAAWGNPEEALQQDQFWVVFEACVTRLPANTARVFMMREFLEYSTPDICSELKISESNCNVILHRARNGLRACLEQTWFGGTR